MACYNVLRLSLLTGCSLSPKKNFFDRIKNDLQNNKEIEMIDGMRRQVISFSAAAEYIYRLSLIDNERLPDIINICGDELYSKYEMGCAVARSLGVSEDLVKKISENDGMRFFLDRRAACVNMDNSLLKKLLCLDEIPCEPSFA